MDTMASIGTDFLKLVFDIVLFLLLLRLLLQLTRADFYNPLSQAIVRTTAFLDPLRKMLGAWNGLDITTLIAILAVTMLEMILLLGTNLSPGVLLALAGITLLDQLALFFIIAIFLVVILSFLAPDGRNPAAQLLWSLTEPLLGPARRLLPPLGGIDFSPMLVLFLIYVVRNYLIPALSHAVLF